jgi:LPS export ABC transporter protein LptC
MTSRSLRFPQVGAVVLAFLLAGAVAGCGPGREQRPMGSAAEMPDQEVSDFVLTETDEGAPQWTLHAKYAATYTSRSVVVARDIRVDFFDEEGQRSSELTAREGEIQQNTRDMTARGNVVLKTTEGTRMTTQEMHFSNTQQLITSSKLVRVERDGSTLEGVGFSSDPDLRRFEFKSQVDATVRTRNGAVIETRNPK